LDNLTDDADWKGIDMSSVGVVGKTHGYEYRSYMYVTPGEVAVAKLLGAQAVPFTPDVFIKIATPLWTEGLPMVYVPDFVFNRRPYVWIDADGHRELIHGIEVKHRGRAGNFPKRGLRKIAVLREARGISVKILDELWVRMQTYLPIEPYDFGS